MERGFSDSAKNLTSDRANMALKTLDARLMVREGLRRFDFIPYKVPISNELLNMSRNAHREYQLHLEEERRKEEKKNKEIQLELERAKKEEEILKEITKESNKLKDLESQLQEAEKKHSSSVGESEEMQMILSESTKNNTTPYLAVIDKLVSGLTKLRNEEKTRREEVDNIRKRVDKRKLKLEDLREKKKAKMDISKNKKK